MWLSRTLRGSGVPADTEAELGVTTIGGEAAGVYARGEVREVRICTPGGVRWRPRPGDRVLVLKGGTGGEERFVLGVESGEGELEDGELFLSVGGASIRLKNDGTVAIDGHVLINGTEYKPCTCTDTGGIIVGG